MYMFIYIYIYIYICIHISYNGINVSYRHILYIWYTKLALVKLFLRTSTFESCGFCHF